MRRREGERGKTLALNVSSVLLAGKRKKAGAEREAEAEAEGEEAFFRRLLRGPGGTKRGRKERSPPTPPLPSPSPP